MLHLSYMNPNELSPYTLVEQGTALPEIDLSCIVPFLAAALIATTAISVLFGIYLIYSTLRRRKLNQATLDMQKDIRKIRELLEQGSALRSPTSAPYDTARVPTEKPSPELNLAEDLRVNQLESE